MVSRIAARCGALPIGGIQVTDDKAGHQDRKDTKAAKAAERADIAGQI